MKALVCSQPGELQYIDVTAPVLEKDRAIIRMKRVGICGTDLHAFGGTQPYFSYPRILGHELSGELVEFDNAPGFELNEMVSIIPYYNCGECIACRKGMTNCCSALKVCGVHVDGGMTEYLSVPSGSLIHGGGLSLDELALIEPLAIGAHGIRRAMVETGEFVLVVGAGPIGLGTMEFARIAGAKVIALDVNERRLQYCREHFQVDYIINASTRNVVKDLQDITSGNMPTVVIDATGNLNAINNAFQYLAHSGRYVLIGLQKGDISFSHPEFHKREATLMSSRNATAHDFALVMDSIRIGNVRTDQYITHRVTFDALGETFGKFLNPEHGVIKAMVEFS